MSRTRVKICGITDAAGLQAAAEADFVGFVFFAASPRAMTPARLRTLPAGGPRRVGLFVDADDALLADAAPLLDMIQLHGRESPARVAEVRRRFGRPVMKAIGVATEADLRAVRDYAGAADMLLLDAKPSPDATRPGGNARSFDWGLARRASLPPIWMLAGGLTPLNVAEAIAASGAPAVDVSSGVESAPGAKDARLVKAFIAAARGGAPAAAGVSPPAN
jgi:phosphoribosylanthranilate isomerase